MGEYAREVREVDGEKRTFCTAHDCPLEWIELRGRRVFTCPGCARGEAGLKSQHGPLIRWGQTFWRDRPLTAKEEAHKPKNRSI